MTETLSPAIPEDIERLTDKVLKTAEAKKRTLTTAESCTGGLLASLLTDVEGASHVFERGFVVYSEEAKCELLGIAPGTIERCGVVSKEVAVAMAEGAIAASQADIALAVTGFAGPAGEGDEPGLVHLACACRDGPTLHREEHFGDIGRGAVRLACMRIGLDMMLRAMA